MFANNLHLGMRVTWSAGCFGESNKRRDEDSRRLTVEPHTGLNHITDFLRCVVQTATTCLRHSLNGRRKLDRDNLPIEAYGWNSFGAADRDLYIWRTIINNYQTPAQTPVPNPSTSTTCRRGSQTRRSLAAYCAIIGSCGKLISSNFCAYGVGTSAPVTLTAGASK